MNRSAVMLHLSGFTAAQEVSMGTGPLNVLRRIRTASVLGALWLSSACSTAPARPTADPMAAYYGNTLICSGATWECHMWLNKDGTYILFAMDIVDGKPTVRGLEGRWALINGRFCRDPEDPKRNSCNFPQLATHEEGRQLGERWEGLNRGGQPEHFQLVPGHR